MVKHNNDLHRYLEAQRYIDLDVVRLTPRRRDRDAKLATVRQFNAALGDPQAAWPAIQVAGTSGKGSVSLLLARALHASGLRTGLHVSPYLQVITEKTWIDGRYCSPGAFADAVDRIRPVAERYRHDEDCPTSVHGMASLAASYEVFRKEKIDICVMETGVGGRFDLVQGLDRRLCVITDLGLDHTKALGETLDEIAWHKAGVMEAGVPCVAVRGPGWPVLEDEARSIGAPLHPVEPTGEAALDLPHLGRVDLRLPSPAAFQLRNAAVAAAALDRLAAEGWPVTASALEEACAGFRYPGRFENIQQQPEVVLDGAHNAQKMDGLLASLTRTDQVIVLGLTGAKDPAPVLQRLKPFCRQLIATAPDLYGKAVVAPEDIRRKAEALSIRATTAPSPIHAVNQAIDQAGPAGAVLVTGSLYLVGQVRERWHPWQQILAQGTSWPLDNGPTLDHT